MSLSEKLCYLEDATLRNHPEITMVKCAKVQDVREAVKELKDKIKQTAFLEVYETPQDQMIRRAMRQLIDETFGKELT